MVYEYVLQRCWPQVEFGNPTEELDHIRQEYINTGN